MSADRYKWPAERRLERDCVEIAFWTFGEGHPLMLVTGLATPAGAWGPLPQLLADHGYRVIVVDNRDAGKSSRCDGLEYSLKDMADDAVAVLDELNIDRAYVLGISMGGMIVQELALNHPERVERLLLMATDPGMPDRIVDEEFWMDFLSIPPGEPKQYMRQVLSKITAPGFADENKEVIDWMADARVLDPIDLAAFQRQWQAVLAHSTAERLKHLEIPTLILHGEMDRMVKYENGPLLSKLIPGAELVSIPGAGHLLPIEKPAEVLSAISRFFPAHQEAAAG